MQARAASLLSIDTIELPSFARLSPHNINNKGTIIIPLCSPQFVVVNHPPLQSKSQEFPRRQNVDDDAGEQSSNTTP